jgi:hypothetical protein
LFLHIKKFIFEKLDCHLQYCEILYKRYLIIFLILLSSFLLSYYLPYLIIIGADVEMQNRIAVDQVNQQKLDITNKDLYLFSTQVF